MLTTQVRGFNNAQKAQQQVSFGRRLKDGEKAEYKKTVQQALTQLDKKNFSLIVQGPSFPSVMGEDVGTGSPYTKGAQEFMTFLDNLGFNSVQVGPAGKTKRSDASPYTSTVYSDNTLFIDLKALTTPAWGEILSDETFDKIVTENELAEKGRVNYEYAHDKSAEALKEAWENYKVSAAEGEDPAVNKITELFNDYKASNTDWLESDALYEGLAKANDNDFWKNWSEVDQNLPKWMISEDADLRNKANQRIMEVFSDPEIVDEMDFYKFSQFIVSQQKEEIVAKAPVNSIADAQVTYSDRDWWAFQNLFLEDKVLGCPPDAFSETGQDWGFPVLNPDLLFEREEDGSIKMDGDRMVLGRSGRLLKSRFDKMFKDNPGGVRIDHIVGLIDPWVYPADAETAMKEDGGQRLFSSPESCDAKVAEWAKVDKEALNPGAGPDSEEKISEEALKSSDVVNKYSEIIDIIIQSAKDNNVPLSNIICEDLGTLTNPVKAVLEERGLSGIRVTQFADPNDKTHMYQGRNVASKQWIVGGTHDNNTLAGWTEDVMKDGSVKDHARYLADDLRITNVKKLTEDPHAFMTAKLAELFASPAQNVQIFFTDLFGIKERYNTPATDASKNWRLRVPNNYDDVYHKNLENDKGLNLPEVLKVALDARGMGVNDGLQAKLETFAQILKEKE